MEIAYLRKPKSKGRPVSEALTEDDLYLRITGRPDIKAYTEHIRSAPDAAAKGPVYAGRKADKKNGPHAAVFSLSLGRGRDMSPAPTDDSYYNGLIHVDIDDYLDEHDRRIPLPDIPRAWSELAAMSIVRWLAHSLSGALWIVVATDNKTIKNHRRAWEHVVAQLPAWIQPYVGSASSAVNGLRFIAHCPCCLYRPQADLLHIPEAPVATPEVRISTNSRNGQPRRFSLRQSLPATGISLEWLGVELTLQRLSRHGQRIGDTVRLDCPAHNGSASTQHLAVTAADGRLLARCFSDKCRVSYSTLSAAIEQLIQCRLSPLPGQR